MLAITSSQKLTLVANDRSAVLGDDHFDALTAGELVGEDLATTDARAAIDQTWHLACTASRQASRHGVLAAGARIFDAPGNFDWRRRWRNAAHRFTACGLRTVQAGIRGVAQTQGCDQAEGQRSHTQKLTHLSTPGKKTTNRPFGERFTHARPSKCRVCATYPDSPTRRDELNLLACHRPRSGRRASFAPEKRGNRDKAREAQESCAATKASD